MKFHSDRHRRRHHRHEKSRQRKLTHSSHSQHVEKFTHSEEEEESGNTCMIIIIATIVIVITKVGVCIFTFLKTRPLSLSLFTFLTQVPTQTDRTAPSSLPH